MSDLLRIDDVVIGERHRSDMGDIKSLAASIQKVGLLHPVVVTPEHHLVAGQRRLEACRKLGMEEVPVRVVHTLTSAASLLEAERDENECRKEMTPLERKSLADALLSIEKPKATERQAHGTTAPGRKANAVAPRSHSVGDGGRAEQVAAKAAGYSRTSHQRTTEIVETAADESQPPEVRKAAQEAMADLEAGVPIRTAHAKVRDIKSAKKAAAPPAPKQRKTRGKSPTQTAVAICTSLESIGTNLDSVNFDDIDIREVEPFLVSLPDARRSINRFIRWLTERRDSVDAG